ncbi:MAG: SPOR domain-containing protein [Bacteroidota bacterium]
MREFDRHIHSLLLDHDCVIVPELGGFIASRQQAHIDSIRQMGFPPKRSIAFNVYLRQNDGLLAKRLVETEHVSYPAALQEIEAFVSDCLRSMGRGEKIVIRQVGSLSIDASKNIQFEPDENSPLCPDAFGLSSLPVHVLDPGRKLVNAPRPVTGIKKKQPAKRSEKQRSLVGVLAVVGALLWFSLNVYLVSKDRYGMAGINPLDSIVPQETPAPAVPEENTTPPVNVSDVQDVAVNETAKDIRPEKEEVPVIPTPADIHSPAEKYFVIAGVFTVKGNADRLVKRLKRKGFSEAAIVDQTDIKYYVGVAGFGNEADAAAYRDQLVSQRIDGWVYQR